MHNLQFVRMHPLRTKKRVNTMMRGFLTITFLIMCMPVQAQGLTPAECEEVRLIYGIISQGCSAAPTTQVVTGDQDARTLKQIESHIFFSGGGSNLDPVAQDQLARLALILQTVVLQNTCLRLVGHSDASGTPDANLTLSERRAKLVADALVEQGIDPIRVKQIHGMGETAPLSNLSESSRWQRRVAIELKQCSTEHDLN